MDLVSDQCSAHTAGKCGGRRTMRMNVSRTSSPGSLFLSRTYRRTVDSPSFISGFSCRTRTQIRCAVCRCFRGAFRSASKISSMKSAAGSSFDRCRTGVFCAGQRLPHHPPPVYPELAHHSRDRSLAVLVFPPHLFERRHRRSPLDHPASLPGHSARTIISRQCVSGWAKLGDRNGPI